MGNLTSSPLTVDPKLTILYVLLMAVNEIIGCGPCKLMLNLVLPDPNINLTLPPLYVNLSPPITRRLSPCLMIILASFLLAPATLDFPSVILIDYIKVLFRVIQKFKQHLGLVRATAFFTM